MQYLLDNMFWLAIILDYEYKLMLISFMTVRPGIDFSKETTVKLGHKIPVITQM